MKGLSLVLSLVVYLALQTALAGRIAIGSVAPDFVVVCVILFGLQRGTIPGTLFGFFAGLVVDLGNPGHLGLNALAKAVLGYAAGRLGATTTAGALMLGAFFFAGSFVHDVIYLAVFHWPHPGTTLLSIVTNALPSALYTAVAGIVVERLLALLGAKVVTTIGKERQ